MYVRRRNLNLIPAPLELGGHSKARGKNVQATINHSGGDAVVIVAKGKQFRVLMMS
jgi:hypothetical protein